MKTIKKTFFLPIFLIIGLNSNVINAEYEEIPLEHLACWSNTYGFNMSPKGTYLAILTSPKENICDIHDIKSEYVEKESRYRGLTIINLSDMSRRVLFTGKPGDGISMFDWVSDERFVFMPQAFEQVGRNMNALQVFAMNADGSKKRSLLEYNFGAEGLRGFEVYNMNLENEDEVFVYWNDRRSRVSDYYKLNINTGVPRLLARGPDIDSYEVIYGSIEDDEGYPVGVLTDVGIERVLYTYDKKTKKWSEHYRYTCQDPSYVPVALAGDG